MRKLHRYGFFATPVGLQTQVVLVKDYSRRVTHVTACGQLIGTYYPVKAVPDEHFVHLDRDRQCRTCETRAWPRGRRPTTHDEREEFTCAIERWLIELSRLGDAMRAIGHGRCHHANAEPHRYRSCGCGTITWTDPAWCERMIAATLLPDERYQFAFVCAGCGWRVAALRPGLSSCGRCRSVPLQRDEADYDAVSLSHEYEEVQP